METLAKQIEQRMHGEWKHCMIRDEHLERIWPINEKDREKKIAQFAKKYGFRLRFYGKGMGAIFDKWPPQELASSRRQLREKLTADLSPYGNKMKTKIKTTMKPRIPYSHRGNEVVRSILASIIFAAGVVLTVAALGDSPSLLAQTDIASASPEFPAGVGTHETRTESQDALHFPNASEITNTVEAFSAATPTRSSFMATWDNVTGATGYLLDVSASSSFSSYVDGYHDLNVGNVAGSVVTGLNPGSIYYYRVRAYGATGIGEYSEVMTGTTVSTTGLTIRATFDSSITGNPNAAAIEAMINRAISTYESLFSDPITIQIRFRYARTGPDDTPLPPRGLAQSNFVIYTIPWGTFINALRADATTSNDNLANASLPGSALSPHIVPSSADGRAVGLNTPPAMFANGTVGPRGPYDGIVTLNSAYPFQFNRPTSGNNFDAQRSTEHEIDEVLGLGSRLGTGHPDLRPQDLFSWSSPSHRNITSSGTRYFSINDGSTNIVGFNQNPNGDFGDWLSTSCPQAHPYVQNAFSCAGQSSDVTHTSPEGTNLDVIGYDLVSAMGPPVVTTNPATNVTRSSATLHGSLNPHGLTTTVHLQYGTTTSYGLTTAPQTQTGNTFRNVSANIGGLTAHTTYHFRIVASNSDATRYGVDRAFVTP